MCKQIPYLYRTMRLEQYIIQKISTAMHERGYTQAGLAKKSGVTEATISRVLNGGPVKVAVADKILKALDLQFKIEA